MPPDGGGRPDIGVRDDGGVGFAPLTTAHAAIFMGMDDDGGTEFLVHIDLPAGRAFTVGDVYPHVYGIRIDDGAKPWPSYRDASTGKWWNLHTSSDAPIDGLGWKIDLIQLAYKSPSTIVAWLTEVLAELDAAARRLGATSRPEGSVGDAVAKMERAVKQKSIQDAEIMIIVAEPDGAGWGIREWWDALQAAGFHHGDGNLFWLALPDAQDPDGSAEICAEPFSRQGYFHRGDFDTDVTLPDVGLHVRIRETSDPLATLALVEELALRVASRLDARLFDAGGESFEPEAARRAVEASIARSNRALRDAASRAR